VNEGPTPSVAPTPSKLLYLELVRYSKIFRSSVHLLSEFSTAGPTSSSLCEFSSESVLYLSKPAREHAKPHIKAQFDKS
jgi:hypothetical protein